MKLYLILICTLAFSIPVVVAQNVDFPQGDKDLLEIHTDSMMAKPMSKEARFFRPTTFKSSSDKGSFAIGGYTEANTQYFVTDGEGEGLHFQFRALHLFTLSSFYNDRIQFITNIGFDPTANQFNLTEAALNIAFHPAFNLRGGVILPPIGYYNQNGDAPLSDLVDWPLSSTTIIPSRLSEVGFGINGKLVHSDQLAFSYELYAVNGLQNGIVDNDLPRTAIDLGRPDNLFGADNNDQLAFTGRVGMQVKGIGEVGVSYYGGAYNTTEIDEIEIDESRSLSILALDGQFQIQKLSVKGEIALVNIDVFDGLDQLFGERQLGYHLEASYPIFEGLQLLGQNTNHLNFALRYEVADYHVGLFEQTSTKVFDEIKALRAGFALHLGHKTLVKANYSYLWDKDILGNLSKTGGIQFGIASYF